MIGYHSKSSTKHLLIYSSTYNFDVIFVVVVVFAYEKNVICFSATSVCVNSCYDILN